MLVPTTQRKESAMSMMCSMQSCKTKCGMCGHEKMMVGMIVMLALGTVGYLMML